MYKTMLCFQLTGIRDKSYCLVEFAAVAILYVYRPAELELCRLRLMR